MEERPVPVLPLEYEVETARPFRAVLRAVGIACVIVSAITLVSVIFQSWYFARRTPTYSTWMRDASFFLIFADFALCVLGLTGGVLCLQLSKVARRLLIVWSWGRLAYTAVIICVNGYNYFSSGITTSLVSQYMYLLSRTAVGMTLPLVVLVFFKHREIDAGFKSDR